MSGITRREALLLAINRDTAHRIAGTDPAPILKGSSMGKREEFMPNGPPLAIGANDVFRAREAFRAEHPDGPAPSTIEVGKGAYEMICRDLRVIACPKLFGLDVRVVDDPGYGWWIA